MTRYRNYGMLTLAVFGGLFAAPAGTVERAAGEFRLTSPAFAANGTIPQQYTCEGNDRAPPLHWSGTPQGTQSLALIMDDPDAPDPRKPQRIWVHWVVYNLPGKDGTLPEGVEPHTLPAGTLLGQNDWGRSDYGGPCPPIGEHRYFFKLYALSERLPDLRHPTKSQLEHAMRGKILARAELLGRYQKHR